MPALKNLFATYFESYKLLILMLVSLILKALARDAKARGSTSSRRFFRRKVES